MENGLIIYYHAQTCLRIGESLCMFADEMQARRMNRSMEDFLGNGFWNGWKIRLINLTDPSDTREIYDFEIAQQNWKGDKRKGESFEQEFLKVAVCFMLLCALQVILSYIF